MSSKMAAILSRSKCVNNYAFLVRYLTIISNLISRS